MSKAKVKRRTPLRKREHKKDRYFRYGGMTLGILAGILGIYFNITINNNNIVGLILNLLIILAAVCALIKVSMAAIALIILGLVISLGQGLVIGVLAIFAAIILLLGADVKDDKL